MDWGGLIGGIVSSATTLGGELIRADTQQSVANANKQIAANNLAAEQARQASQERIAKMMAQSQQSQTQSNVKTDEKSGFSISPTTGILIGVAVLAVVTVVVVVATRKPKAPPAAKATAK